MLWLWEAQNVCAKFWGRKKNQSSANQSSREFFQYIENYVAERRHKPADDLITHLINAEQGRPKWVQVKDKRITFIGKILRRTRLDEIPQLICVLNGESILYTKLDMISYRGLNMILHMTKAYIIYKSMYDIK